MARTLKLDPNMDPTQEKMSKEELSERREEITSFYKDNIPHLTVQAEYEALLADIEKSRAERMQAQMFLAQTYAAQQEGAKGVDPNSEEAQAFKEAMEKAAEQVK
jgi:Tfp pilus assembly protein PilF